MQRDAKPLDAKVHSSRVRRRVAYDATPPVLVGSARTSRGEAALRPGRIWRCKLHSCNYALLPHSSSLPPHSHRDDNSS